MSTLSVYLYFMHLCTLLHTWIYIWYTCDIHINVQNHKDFTNLFQVECPLYDPWLFFYSNSYTLKKNFRLYISWYILSINIRNILHIYIINFIVNSSRFPECFPKPPIPHHFQIWHKHSARSQKSFCNIWTTSGDFLDHQESQHHMPRRNIRSFIFMFTSIAF